MYSIWTKNLKDPEEKNNFESSILGSKKVLERLKEILDEERLGLDYTEMDIKSFDTPGWDYKQAYKNGYRAALKYADMLINLDNQKVADNE